MPFFRGEAKAPRVKVVPLKSHSSKCQRQDPSPGLLVFKVPSPHEVAEAKREGALGSLPLTPVFGLLKPWLEAAESEIQLPTCRFALTPSPSPKTLPMQNLCSECSNRGPWFVPMSTWIHKAPHPAPNTPVWTRCVLHMRPLTVGRPHYLLACNALGTKC